MPSRNKYSALQQVNNILSHEDNTIFLKKLNAPGEPLHFGYYLGFEYGNGFKMKKSACLLKAYREISPLELKVIRDYIAKNMVGNHEVNFLVFDRIPERSA